MTKLADFPIDINPGGNKLYRERVPSPRTRNARPISTRPSGTHDGGSCIGCGRALNYWMNYQLCDVCVVPGNASS